MSVGEFFITVIASLLFTYLIVCTVAVQVYAWKEHTGERDCAEQYQVYECIKVEEWKPKEARHDFPMAFAP